MWKQPKCPLTREQINNVLCVVYFFKSGILMQPVGQIQRGLFLYCLQAKNGFYVFKVLFRKRRRNRYHMWPAKPKTFTFWPFTENVCCPLIHSYMRTIWMCPSNVIYTCAV